MQVLMVMVMMMEAKDEMQVGPQGLGAAGAVEEKEEKEEEEGGASKERKPALQMQEGTQGGGRIHEASSGRPQNVFFEF